MSYIHLLISGHGGWVNDSYSIINKGAKQYHFTSGKLEGLSVYEGVENRKICATLAEVASWTPNLEVIWLNQNNPVDIPIPDRIKLVQDFIAKNKGRKIMLHEIHLNASATTTKGAGGAGHGYEFFTTVGKSTSDLAKNIILEEFNEKRPNCRSRGAKERNFWLIRQTEPLCPSILHELWFFDNVKDVTENSTREGLQNNINALITAFRRINTEL